MIWFLVIKLVMLLLFMMIFVVVMLELIVVSFWCQESSWLCVGVCWPNGDGGDDVGSCVVHVVFMVVMVVICVCCDGVIHGNLL